MEMRDYFDFPSDLSDAEKQAVVTNAKYLLMRFTRHLITERLDEALADKISQEALRRLDGAFGTERARLIVRCASGFLMAHLFSANLEKLTEGKELGGRMLAHYFFDAEGVVPPELHKFLIAFSGNFSGNLVLMHKGQAREHMQDSLGFELGDQTPRLARAYYGLRKELESPEEKRRRRSGAGKAGALLEEVVACELNISVGTLRDWLKKADAF
jgi:hypothetical protein